MQHLGIYITLGILNRYVPVLGIAVVFLTKDKQGSSLADWDYQQFTDVKFQMTRDRLKHINSSTIEVGR